MSNKQRTICGSISSHHEIWLLNLADGFSAAVTREGRFESWRDASGAAPGFKEPGCCQL